MKYEIFPLSEQALTVYFDPKISPEINDLVISACDWIKKHPFHGFQEVVPAYNSFTIFYNLLLVSSKCGQGHSPFKFVKNYAKTIPLENLKQVGLKGEIVEIMVDYNGEDLELTAEQTGLDIQEIIHLHTQPLYRVYMMGFLPGFAYLGGLNPLLNMPRREKPRLKVQKGSVGIAGNQTGIYPFESPGGWQIIGRTKQDLFDSTKRNMALLKAGDRVRFIKV